MFKSPSVKETMPSLQQFCPTHPTKRGHSVSPHPGTRPIITYIPRKPAPSTSRIHPDQRSKSTAAYNTCPAPPHPPPASQSAAASHPANPRTRPPWSQAPRQTILPEDAQQPDHPASE
ncbi:MAG: hypothetical protein B7Z58_01380 [Acidiphilium sp. 37-64-53]|nr:MAG: hypothetical protein B7Z58_01380 [Acidiphilium sp. 37-64-53]OZB29573.1 MAG: hypothetical protein B7X49_06175 [Acidiphilium sp. 34-64-41]